MAQATTTTISLLQLHNKNRNHNTEITACCTFCPSLGVACVKGFATHRLDAGLGLDGGVPDIPRAERLFQGQFRTEKLCQFETEKCQFRSLACFKASLELRNNVSFRLRNVSFARSLARLFLVVPVNEEGDDGGQRGEAADTHCSRHQRFSWGSYLTKLTFLSAVF